MHEVDFSLLGIFKQMGVVAKVVGLILVVLSIWSFHILIDRWLAFRAARRDSAKAIDEAYERFYENKLVEAAEVTRKYPKGHLAVIMGAALSSYLHDVDRGAPPDFEACERAIEKSRGLVVSDLKSGLTMLATISSSAPFIGLFGTVVGVINSFTGMAKTGSGGLGAVSAGIAEALIETAMGLAVAIPAVWIYNYFNGRVEEVQTEIDTLKADIMDHLIRRETKNAGAKAGKSGA